MLEQVLDIIFKPRTLLTPAEWIIKNWSYYLETAHNCAGPVCVCVWIVCWPVSYSEHDWARDGDCGGVIHKFSAVAP